MTNSESQARELIKKLYKDCIILKIPDFKQTFNHHAAGWPDFLVVSKGKVFFVEVKTYKNKTLTPAQKAMFPKLIAEGASIYIFEKQKRGFKQLIYHQVQTVS